MRKDGVAVHRVVGALGVGLALAWASPARPQPPQIRLHVRVETQGGPGTQVSRFWAFTTTDEAGAQEAPVTRLCVTGVGHETRERCEENVSRVELSERAVGLTGVGNRCVEALAVAVWRTVPINATARACP